MWWLRGLARPLLCMGHQNQLLSSLQTWSKGTIAKRQYRISSSMSCSHRTHHHGKHFLHNSETLKIADSFYNVKKNRQRILVRKTNIGVFGCLQDKTLIKMPILWKHRVGLFSLLRFFDELFDVIINDPFLTL